MAFARDALPSPPTSSLAPRSPNRTYTSPADSEDGKFPRTPLTGGGTRLNVETPRTRTGQTSALLDRISRLQSRLNERVNLAGMAMGQNSERRTPESGSSRLAAALLHTPESGSSRLTAALLREAPKVSPHFGGASPPTSSHAGTSPGVARSLAANLAKEGLDGGVGDASPGVGM
ncbi:hypothetical protein T484DRAFT_1902653, partial [Baffinella frigidus]